MEISSRDQFYKLLKLHNAKIGVELGVKRGNFSSELAKRYKFETFFCIDKWNYQRSVQHYFSAIKRLQKFNIITLRLAFDEAVLLFEDNYFDFIYIDGNARGGQENGKTLNDWYPKLKSGGIFSGHDYHKKWQSTIDVVNEFCSKNKKTITLTVEDRFPSWWFIK